MEPENLSLEERIARIEGKLGWRAEQKVISREYFWSACGLLSLGIFCGFMGLGAPNHFYQIVLAGLTIALCYHRGWLIQPQLWYEWGLSVLSVLSLSVIYKLFIGGGVRYPFFWAMYPTLSSGKAEEQGSWAKVVPDLSLDWLPSAAAQWPLDLTIIQTFLLLITLIGAFFSFQPFVSLTALLLIVISLPSLVGFSWSWVFPAMILISIGLYLQAPSE